MSKKMIPLLVIILSIFIITPVIAENLVSFYRFDESTGTIACDSTGNGHTGTVSGIGVVWSPAGGYHDGAVYFDATITGSKNGAVQVPTAGISNSAGAITFWAKLANPQSRSYRNGYGYFFGTGGGNAAYLMLYMDNYDTQLDLKIGGTIVENIINLNTNSWFHVAIVWNGTTYALYVNEGLYTSGAYSGFTSLQSTMNIGNSNGTPAKALHGWIDEFKIYNTALGEGDIYSTMFRPSPAASGPIPSNADTNVDISANLSWTAGAGVARHDIYLGTINPPPFIASQTSTIYPLKSSGYDWSTLENLASHWLISCLSADCAAMDINGDGIADMTDFAIHARQWMTAGGVLEACKTYYWRIDEVGQCSTTTGSVWSFTTASATTYYVAADGEDSWDGLSPAYQGGTAGPKATIQAAIDIADTGTPENYNVIKVLKGTYTVGLANNERVKFKYDNVKLVLEEGVVVEGDGSGIRDGWYSLFYLGDRNNISIEGEGDGAAFRMKPNAVGHVILLAGSRNVKMSGLTLKDAAYSYDGILIVGDAATKRIPCRNIEIKDVTCDHNGRQGISVISADSLLIENCTLTRNYFDPGCAIDFEPDLNFEVLKNIRVINTKMENNANLGITMYLGNLTPEKVKRGNFDDPPACLVWNSPSYWNDDKSMLHGDPWDVDYWDVNCGGEGVAIFNPKQQNSGALEQYIFVQAGDYYQVQFEIKKWQGNGTLDVKVGGILVESIATGQQNIIGVHTHIIQAVNTNSLVFYGNSLGSGADELYLKLDNISVVDVLNQNGNHKQVVQDISVSFENVEIIGGDGFDGYPVNRKNTGINIYGVDDEGPRGLIHFQNAVVRDVPTGTRIWYKNYQQAEIVFENCIWKDLKEAQTSDDGPIEILSYDSWAGYSTGGINFTNCQIFDFYDRPAVVEMGNLGFDTLYDITGNIYVHNDNRILSLCDWGGAVLDSSVTLNVHKFEPEYAHLSQPVDGTTGVSLNADLSWDDGLGAVNHHVYFGTTNPPPFVGDLLITSCQLPTLSCSTVYYWRIDEEDSAGTVTHGAVWSFSTFPMPGQAYSPQPADGGIASIVSNLSWPAGSNATSRNLYFGTTNPPYFVCNQTTTSFDPHSLLKYGVTYYWQVNEINVSGTTTGAIWSFTTAKCSDSLRQCHGDADGLTAGSRFGYYYVSPNDLGILSAAYGTRIGDQGYIPCADFDRDGDVDDDDVSILDSYWQVEEPPNDIGVPADCSLGWPF